MKKKFLDKMEMPGRGSKKPGLAVAIGVGPAKGGKKPGPAEDMGEDDHEDEELDAADLEGDADDQDAMDDGDGDEQGADMDGDGDGDELSHVSDDELLQEMKRRGLDKGAKADHQGEDEGEGDEDDDLADNTPY